MEFWLPFGMEFILPLRSMVLKKISKKWFNASEEMTFQWFIASGGLQ